jgi:hypothetical protein
LREGRQDLPPHPVHELELARLARAGPHEAHEDAREVPRPLGVRADQDDGVVDARHLLHGPGDASRDELGLLEARPFRHPHRHFELRLVVLREEVLARQHEQRDDREEGEDRGEDDGPSVGHRPAEEPNVAPLDRPEEARLLALLRVRLEPPGREHRRHGERHEERYHDGERHREAERVEELADDPAHERDRQEHRHERERRREHCEADLARSLPRRLERGEPLLLHEPEDVLEDDDGIVDDDADREREREEREDVQREAHVPHEAERAHDGRRDRDGGDEGRAPVAQEEEHHAGGEERADNEVLLHRVDGVVDVDRLVADHAHGVTLGEPRPDLLEPLLHPLDHGDRVRARLLLDREDHERPPVDVARADRLLHAVLDRADVAQPHLAAVAGGDHDVAERLDRRHAPREAHRQRAGPLLQAAARHLQVLPLDGARYLGRREAIRAQAARVEPQVDLPQAGADERDLADAVERLELAPQRLVGELADLPDGAVGRQRDVEDRRRVGVELVDDRRLDVGRQVGQHLVDLVPHLLRRHVGVLLEDELHDDERHPLGRHGAELLDAGDGVDRPLDLVGDLGLDLFRRRAALDRRHRHRREVDPREPVDAEAEVPEDPHDDEREDEDRREDRSLERDLGEPLHRSTPPAGPTRPPRTRPARPARPPSLPRPRGRRPRAGRRRS